MTPEELQTWTPSGCLDDDLAFLAEVAFLLSTCKAVLDAWSDDVGKMMAASGPETWRELPTGGRVELERKQVSWEWDDSHSVLSAICDATTSIPADTFDALIECLPPHPSWRLGDKKKGTPGLRRFDINPSRHRAEKNGGDRPWVLRFNYGSES